MNTTEGVRWETPPQRYTRRVHPDWPAIAEELRARPGEWLLIFEGGPAAVATAVITDSIACHCLRKSDGFEWRTANNTKDYPRTCDFYMRWVKPSRKRT